MEQFTEEQAIAFAESQIYQNMTLRQIAELQLVQKRLCVPFDIFHEAMEKTLGRPVFTHEFARNVDGLRNELFHGAEPPSMDDILNLVPKDKLHIINIDSEPKESWRGN